MVKMTLLFNDETMETLRKKAKAEGFERPALLARYLMVRGLKDDIQAEVTEDDHVIHVPVNNYRELQGYAEEKKLGNVAVFATYAMDRQMKKNALTSAQKRRVEERYGISIENALEEPAL
jgi:hypothetical protein